VTIFAIGTGAVAVLAAAAMLRARGRAARPLTG
jgi:hypothetical protein